LETSNARKVCKFRLELIENQAPQNNQKKAFNLEHERIIPAAVKFQVWKRDKGQCVICGNKENLHFDHIIPYSKGGSSLLVENIQLLCARHNIGKERQNSMVGR
ncbi:MAG: HNH endonuclease, partial [Nitrosopumilus sp.]